METKGRSRPCRPVISQAQNNTTLWIGHLQSDPNNHFAGQTFVCPDDGQLDNIQLYSAAVQNEGEIILTLHEFDSSNKQWGNSIATSSIEINRDDTAKWILFELPQVQLKKGATYGFQVHTTKAMVALGEAATGTKQPFTFGHEWSGDSSDSKGHYYSYFSLAFKVELCA